MAWPAWAVHRWTGRYGVLTFLATIVVIVVAANLRLHLWFTARTYPAELAAQRARVGRWIRAADYGFAILMMATRTLSIADDHTGLGRVVRGVWPRLCAWRFWSSNRRRRGPPSRTHSCNSRSKTRYKGPC